MSETISEVVEATAPALTGVWVYDPTDVDGTERNYLFADGRSESITPDATSIQVAGRTDPLIEYGEVTVVGLTLTIFIPFGPDHDAAVQWWRDACDNRRTINYRDNRKRLHWVALPAGVQPTDGRVGTSFAIKLQRVNYDEAVE